MTVPATHWPVVSTPALLRFTSGTTGTPEGAVRMACWSEAFAAALGRDLTDVSDFEQ
jgi:acyl-coenzyme A synthetase/AMP-(fatty) acid ligase